MTKATARRRKPARKPRTAPGDRQNRPADRVLSPGEGRYPPHTRIDSKGRFIGPGRKAPKKVTEDAVRASLCRGSFYEFVKEMWDTVVQEKPVWNWHIRVLCGRMQRMAERVFKGLPKEGDFVVNIPPGTTKSLVMSVMFPAWAWTRMPSFRFIGASYTKDLAGDLSFKTRDVVESDKYRRLFGYVTLREDQNTKGYFLNDRGGWRFSVGVNGSVTGKHAHFIVIDDPLDPNQSVSPADLNASNRWIKETLSTRKVDKVVVPMALVMQRLHEDDPTALFLRRKNVRWLKFPAEAEDGVFPPRYRRYYEDGLLDKVRMPKRVLKDIEADLGAIAYAAQFRQNPAPPGGVMFDVSKIRTGRPAKRWKKLVRYWDKAGTPGGGAYTVGTLMGVDESDRLWVLDVVRGQWGSWEREVKIQETADKDGYKTLIGVEQEPGSGGKESAENTVRRLRGYRVQVDRVDSSTGGKVRRADPWSVQVNGGQVYLPPGAPWAKGWKDEHTYFPNSRYKDQVDSASGAFAMCARPRRRAGGIRPSGKVVA